MSEDDQHGGAEAVEAAAPMETSDAVPVEAGGEGEGEGGDGDEKEKKSRKRSRRSRKYT
jgi:hypothetical protein